MDVVWNPNELCHYGTKGQKWGVRHYQLDDGTWTELGNRRRRIGDGRHGSHADVTSHKRHSSQIERAFSGHNKQTAPEQNKRSFSGTNNRSVSNDEAAKRAHRKEVAKKVAIGVAAVAGIAAAGYLAYKMGKVGSEFVESTTDVNSDKFFDFYNLNKIDSMPSDNIIEVDIGGINYRTKKDLDALDFDIVKYSGSDFESTIQTDAMLINHGGIAGHTLLNRNNNCGYCAITYDLRRRGYDVVANEPIDEKILGITTQHGGMTAEQISEAYSNMFGDKFTLHAGVSRKAIAEQFKKDYLEKHGSLTKDLTYIREYKQAVREATQKPISSEDLTNTLNALTSEGNGARGIINIMYPGGGGHALNYEIHDGKPYIIDSQIGMVFKTREDIGDYFNRCCSISSLRTDGLTPTANGYLNRYVGNRRESTADKEHINQGIKKVATKTAIAAAGIAYVKNYRKQHPKTKKTDAEIKEMYERERKS